MCFAAIHWAGIDAVVYGTRIADVARLGFRELTISNRTMKRLGGSAVRIVPGVSLRDEVPPNFCEALGSDPSCRVPGDVNPTRERSQAGNSAAMRLWIAAAAARGSGAERIGRPTTM